MIEIQKFQGQIINSDAWVTGTLFRSFENPLPARHVIEQRGALFEVDPKTVRVHTAKFGVDEKQKRINEFLDGLAGYGCRSADDLAKEKISAPLHAEQILQAGIQHMTDRAETYDSPGGERSMAATVAAFNEITGAELTEEEGWAFMAVLKLVRSQQGKPKRDNYEDGAAYFALMGESAQEARGDD